MLSLMRIKAPSNSSLHISLSKLLPELMRLMLSVPTLLIMCGRKISLTVLILRSRHVATEVLERIGDRSDSNRAPVQRLLLLDERSGGLRRLPESPSPRRW
jgi:hypothetical protein